MMPNAVVNVERNGVSKHSIRSNPYIPTELIASKRLLRVAIPQRNQ